MASTQILVRHNWGLQEQEFRRWFGDRLNQGLVSSVVQIHVLFSRFLDFYTNY